MNRTLSLFRKSHAVVGYLVLGAMLLQGQPFAAAQSTIEVSDTLVTVIQQVRVPALRAGQVIKLNVAEGDLVEVGQLLAQTDDQAPQLAMQKARSEFETALKAAESQLSVQLATKKYELAKSDLQRAERARAQLAGSVPDEEYENRKLQVERTALEVEKSKEDRQNAVAEARLYENSYRSAELDLKQTRIVSPIAGVVVAIERHKGEWATAGETVLELVGTTRLRAEAMIDFANISEPLVGKRVTLRVDMPNGKPARFRGTIKFESPEINPLDNRVSVWAEIANPQRRLRPGMRGQMTIELSDASSNNGDQTRIEQITSRRTPTKTVDSE